MDEAFRGRANYSGGSGSIVDRLFREDYAGGGGGGRSGKQLNSRRTADRFVLSHVVLASVGDPPMYTAGLRFYQVKDTAYRLHGVGGRDSAAVSDDDVDDEDGEDRNVTSPPTADGDKPRYYQLTVYKDSGELFQLLFIYFRRTDDNRNIVVRSRHDGPVDPTQAGAFFSSETVFVRPGKGFWSGRAGQVSYTRARTRKNGLVVIA